MLSGTRGEYRDHYKDYKPGDYIYLICDVLGTVDRYMIRSYFDSDLYIDVDGTKESIYDILPSRTMNKTEYRRWKINNFINGKEGIKFIP